MAQRTLDQYAALVDTLEVDIPETVDFTTFMEQVGRRLGEKAPATLEGWERMWTGVETRYSALPELGLKLERVMHFPGEIKQYTQISFRDVITGRFVKYETAQDLVREWWGR